MTTRAVVFDIGGVLEITPDLGVTPLWESRRPRYRTGIVSNSFVGGARLEVRPGEMVFLDDSEVCVAGARDAGLHAVCYRDNAQAIGVIEALLS